jgi:hypothetical protein
MNIELAALESELAYRGPERRGGENAGLVRLMASILDEVDYGLMLLSANALVVHANHAALRELGSNHPLELRSRRLRARDGLEQQPLADALDAARHRGVRCMLNLGTAPARVGLSIVPLPLPLSNSASGNAVLLTLQRAQLVENYRSAPLPASEACRSAKKKC